MRIINYFSEFTFNTRSPFELQFCVNRFKI